MTYFWRSTPQNKAFFKQNKGPLGSRYKHTYLFVYYIIANRSIYVYTCILVNWCWQPPKQATNTPNRKKISRNTNMTTCLADTCPRGTWVSGGFQSHVAGGVSGNEHVFGPKLTRWAPSPVIDWVITRVSSVGYSPSYPFLRPFIYIYL